MIIILANTIHLEQVTLKKQLQAISTAACYEQIVFEKESKQKSELLIRRPSRDNSEINLLNNKQCRTLQLKQAGNSPSRCHI